MSFLNLLIVGRPRLSEGFFGDLNGGDNSSDAVPDCAAATRFAPIKRPDLILSELHLPDGDCLGSIAQWSRTCPVVIIAAEATMSERVQAFENGVEDLVTLPVADRELALRVEKALGRWRRRNPETVVRFCDFALDPGSRVLRREGRGEVALSDSERSLLELLLAKPDRPTSRREIARRCLKNTFDETSRAPDMLASKLRAKLRQLGEGGVLETLRGEGYRLRIGGGGASS